MDRLGCRDTDGDGWSDPTENWKAHPFGLADSFLMKHFNGEILMVMVMVMLLLDH